MKIVGQLVCGPGEARRYLKETLGEFKRLCDDEIICLCNAGDEEKALLDKYDMRWYEDNREWGKFQPAIKTSLLKRIQLMKPDWVIVLDADETMPTMTREIFEAWSRRREAMQFYVVNLWGDIEHYSPSMSFWNVRAYSPSTHPSAQFMRKPVHCGNAPPAFYSLSARETYVPHILLHKGLMSKEGRLARAERYAKYDPKAIHKGREYYDALVAQKDVSPYNEKDVINLVKKFYENLKP